MNRLVSVVSLLTLAIALSMGCNIASRQQSPHASRSLVKLVEGEYLSTEYIEELRKTRSPLKAGGSGGMELVQVQRDATKLVLEPIINFHEGDTGFAINQDGSIAALSPTGDSNVSAATLDDHTIRFGYGDFKPTTYLFVGQAATYVADIVLVGRYKDQQGRMYEFKEDGWAVFPDRKFEFEIGLDHVLDDFDYFMDAGHDKSRLPWAVWAFKWNDNTLQIFRTKDLGGVEEIADPHPALSLSHVR